MASTPEELRAARDRSAAMTRESAKREFEEIFWPPQRVISWIAYRDPLLISKNWHQSKLYDHPASKQPGLRDRTPPLTLLRTLQDGRIRAIMNGRTHKPEFWASANGHNWPNVRFRRQEVLSLWPDRATFSGQTRTKVKPSAAQVEAADRQKRATTDAQPSMGAPPKQKKVEQFMKDRVNGWPSQKRKPTEREDLEAARKALGAVRRQQLRDAVAELSLPPGWRKRGPRHY
jgi:hypothetical protein